MLLYKKLFYEPTEIFEKNKNGNLKTGPNFTKPRKTFTNGQNPLSEAVFKTTTVPSIVNMRYFLVTVLKPPLKNGFSGATLVNCP